MSIPLLKEIEKLITEHGSAAILRERIALANDKYAALESDIKVIRSENQLLRSENEALKLDNSKFREQVRAFKEKLSDSHQLSPPEIEQKIVFYLENNPKSSIKQISQANGITQQNVSETLENYRIFGGAKCIYKSHQGDSLWSLT